MSDQILKYYKNILVTFLFFILGTTTLSAANYYWVGGSGNWSDLNHWRTASGGNVLPAVVPRLTDDVFFDANSGFTEASKTITVNVVANCHNITFSGAAVPPAIVSTDKQNSLNIYGSSVLQSGMSYEVLVTNYQNNGEAKTVRSNGVTMGTSAFGSEVNFYEETSVSLNDDFSAKMTVNIEKGTFNTNNHTVTVSETFYLRGKAVNLGSSSIYMTGNDKRLYTGNIILDAGTSTIYFTGTQNSFANPDGLYAINDQTFHNVIFENPQSVRSTIYGSSSPGQQPKFNKVEFKGAGYIENYNTLNELILSAGKTHFFQSDKVQTIKQKLTVYAPDCGGFINIKSNTPGTRATINAPAGAVIDVSRAVIKDLIAQGGANFQALNSVDDGNNTGWTFPEYTGKNLYWVGGRGTWNDRAHWSDVSGGTGGYCIPGPKDNTIFDAGSGFNEPYMKVTVDAVSYTRNITVQGTLSPPMMIADHFSKPLNIYGSMVLQEGMIYYITSTNFQNTDEPKTLTTNGVRVGGSTSSSVNVYENTSFTLLDKLLMGGTLRFYAGTFNTNGYDMILEKDFATWGTTKAINLSTSKITLTDDAAIFSSAGEKEVLLLDAANSVITFSGKFGFASNTKGILGRHGQTYNEVYFTNPGSEGGGIRSDAAIVAGDIKTLNFNKVSFKGSGVIDGNNQFKKLLLAPTKIYKLNAGNIQEVTELFSLNSPACNGYSTLISSRAGASATLSMPASAVADVSGVTMRDITAVGGNSFQAVNSIDLKNNPGWVFTSTEGKNLYWVGGSGKWNDKAHWSFTSGGTGGDCIPGANDNAFFDAGSGFTSTSRQVTLSSITYINDITFQGSATPPVLAVESTYDVLNIYGSSVLQAGMTYEVPNTNYQNSNRPKTITSNGVIMGKRGVNSFSFYETTTIGLLDDFSVASDLKIYAGTFNTNNFSVSTVFSFQAYGVSQTLNLGSSHLYIGDSFNIRANNTVLNAGTSVIHFLNPSSNQYLNSGITAKAGHAFHDIIFESPTSTASVIQGGTTEEPLQFNSVIIKGGGYLYGENVFKKLQLTAGKEYFFGAKSKQTVTERLYASGNPCYLLFMKSSSTGERASIDVTGGPTHFDFVNIRDIQAVTPLTYGQKTTDIGNNANIAFSPYNTGTISGLGSDRLCTTFEESDPATYTLYTDQFAAGPDTTFLWTKVGDDNFPGTLGTGSSLDIRNSGFGTYKVKVTYSQPGSADYCEVEDEITLKQRAEAPIFSGKICKKANNTLADAKIKGTAIHWYETAASLLPLPLSTVIENGKTYFVSDTANGCESSRREVKFDIAPCSRIMINPALPARTK